MTDPRVRGPAYLPQPIALELMKLLVQVAWSDHELHDDEIEGMLHVADALLPSDAHLAEVESWLKHTAPLPPPDLACLKEHKHDVLLEVKRVILADGLMHDDEQTTYAQIEKLLTGP